LLPPLEEQRHRGEIDERPRSTRSARRSSARSAEAPRFAA
jgi:hypothetical protein